MAASVTIRKLPHLALDPLSGVAATDPLPDAASGGGAGAPARAAGGGAGAGGPRLRQRRQQQAAAAAAAEALQLRVEAALRCHFSAAPRRVSVGDVIGVLLPPDTAAADGGGALSGAAGLPRVPGAEDGPEAAAAVYFQVVEAQPRRQQRQQQQRRRPLLVDPSATALSLDGGAARAPLPVGFAGYALAAAGARRRPLSRRRPLLGVDASAAWHPAPGLPGVCGPLLPAWRELARTAAPLLHPAAADVPVRAAALLHGPRGSGKQTAARAAAAALGLNFLPWSCHELRVRFLRVFAACMFA